MAPTPLSIRLTSLFSSSLLLPTLLSPPSIPPTSPLAITNSATACAVATALTRLTAVAHASSLRTPAASMFINHRITSPKTPKPKRIAAGMAQSAMTASTTTAARSPSSVSITDTCPPPLLVLAPLRTKMNPSTSVPASRLLTPAAESLHSPPLCQASQKIHPQGLRRTRPPQLQTPKSCKTALDRTLLNSLAPS